MARVAARLALLTLLAVAAGAVLATRLEGPIAHASRDADRPKAADADEDETAKAGPGVRGIVKLDDDGITKGGIETATPPHEPFQDRQRVYGTVVALDRMTALYNDALTAAAAQKTAAVKLAAADVANGRAQTLLKSFPTAKAQAETAEAALSLESAGAEAAAAQMEALRNTAIQDWGATLGPAIVAHAALATDLVRRRSCLVLLSLPPGQSAAAPRHVTITADGGDVEAALVSAATQVDPRIQGSAFFYIAAAAPGLLPGASVEAAVPNGEATQGFGIPASAVVWQGGKAWVYLRDGADTFRRRALDAATPTVDGGYVVPAASLPHDPALVISGAQILLSQESRSQIPSDEDDQ